MKNTRWLGHLVLDVVANGLPAYCAPKLADAAWFNIARGAPIRRTLKEWG